MKTRYTTLNSKLNWVDVLHTLDVIPESTLLPARTHCPVCQGVRLTVYEDNVFLGQWHYCRDCKRSGDMIELAAAAWNVSPEVAARRIALTGQLPEATTEEIANRVTAHIASRRTFAMFWADCRDHIVNSRTAEIENLCNKFRLIGYLTPGSWRNGPGRIIGSCPKKAVSALFTPEAVETRGRANGASDRFRGMGRGWNDLLVLPFEDMPGRISGFLFVGRNGEDRDKIFASTSRAPNGSRAVADAGLFGRWCVEETCEFGRHIIAMSDPLLVARLQIRHMCLDPKPLPLVAFWDSGKARTGDTWKTIERSPIIWHWDMSPQAVHQAAVSEGLLAVPSMREISSRSIDKYLSYHSPREMVQLAVSLAKPWRRAVAAWADEASDSAVEQLLLSLEAYGELPSGLTTASAKLKRIVRPKPIGRTYQVGSSEYVELGGILHKRKCGKLVAVMNAYLRIDGIEKAEDTSYYIGRLLFKGEIVPFRVPVLKFRKHGNQFLRDLIIETKSEMLYNVVPVSSLLHIAVLARETEY